MLPGIALGSEDAKTKHPKLMNRSSRTETGAELEFGDKGPNAKNRRVTEWRAHSGHRQSSVRIPQTVPAASFKPVLV